jgi:hypothetical protein
LVYVLKAFEAEEPIFCSKAEDDEVEGRKIGETVERHPNAQNDP